MVSDLYQALGEAAPEELDLGLVLTVKDVDKLETAAVRPGGWSTQG